MPTAVTSDEGDRCSFARPGDGNWGGGIAPWSEGVNFSDISEILEGVESCSTDHTQSDRFCDKRSVYFHRIEIDTVKMIW